MIVLQVVPGVVLDIVIIILMRTVTTTLSSELMNLLPTLLRVRSQIVLVDTWKVCNSFILNTEFLHILAGGRIMVI